ncbi:MAG: 2-dehydropantoate 2-reductase [Candidatus Thorarchaeota archaeon]|nr:MAG: 2-dehydropantoate 2-reductase [Candidatus Thorarchaeota archaeon]
MKIVVMGSGAIGSLYGGFLTLNSEHNVTLVGRKPHIDAIASHGLKITGVMGTHVVYPDTTTDPSSIEDADLVLITTKTYDTVTAAKRVSHLVERGAYVMVLQNGIGTEKEIAESLDTKRVIRGTTCMGAIRTGPGKVKVTGTGLTEIGSHFPSNYGFIPIISEMLRSAGFDVKVSDNIEGVVWTKTLVNCGINPIGALTGLTNGEVYENQDLRGLIVQLVEEAVLVVEALGINLTTEDPVRYALGTAKATSSNINSMLQDIRAGKLTEIDSITGKIINYAKELGIPTPASETVYALVKALEAKCIAESDYREESSLDIDKLMKSISTP